MMYTFLFSFRMADEGEHNPSSSEDNSDASLFDTDDDDDDDDDDVTDIGR